MSQVIIVGAGFVGSLFAEEFGKRCFSAEATPSVLVLDDDTVDHRNPANQGFTPADIGRPKAEAVAERLRLYGVDAVGRVERVPANFSADPTESLVIVSCVDTMATRTALWAAGLSGPIPVAQVGLSLDGTGTVEWTGPGWDTWSLSPMALGDQVANDVPSGVTPPCQLVNMRLDGHLIAVAAARAVGAYLGLAEPTRPEAQFGTMLSWRTNRGTGLTCSPDVGVLDPATMRWTLEDSGVLTPA